MRICTPSFIATAGALFIAPSAFAGTVSPVQSGASTVYDLDAVAPVMLARSDDAARDFHDEDMPELMSIVNANLSERNAVLDVADFALDPNPLYLTEASDVRVYFLGEGAGYRNSFGFYTGETTAGITGSDDAALIFPDASMAGGWDGGDAWRSSRAPLSSGDYVDLGSFDADTNLNLFLVANGASGGRDTWYTDPTLNSDGIVHYVALATPDSPYLLIGIEDLPGGGDEDYNDLVIAIDIGVTNVQRMIETSGSTAASTVSSNVAAAPLPPTVWALFGVLGLAVRRQLRRRGRDAAGPGEG